MRVTRLLSLAFLEYIEPHVFRCKLCGEEVYTDKYIEPSKSIRSHFYKKHRGLYIIAYKCMHGSDSDCKILEILKEYFKGGNK